jgi:hypothetical protein
MMLERVSSGPIGFEHRLFECPKCDHVEISVTASDPHKSKAAAMLDRQNQGPECTACGSPTKLTAIEPGSLGFDLRTFTCAQCKKVQRQLIDSTWLRLGWSRNSPSKAR